MNRKIDNIAWVRFRDCIDNCSISLLALWIGQDIWVATCLYISSSRSQPPSLTKVRKVVWGLSAYSLAVGARLQAKWELFGCAVEASLNPHTPNVHGCQQISGLRQGKFGQSFCGSSYFCGSGLGTKLIPTCTAFLNYSAFAWLRACWHSQAYGSRSSACLSVSSWRQTS